MQSPHKTMPCAVCSYLVHPASLRRSSWSLRRSATMFHRTTWMDFVRLAHITMFANVAAFETFRRPPCSAAAQTSVSFDILCLQASAQRSGNVCLRWISVLGACRPKPHPKPKPQALQQPLQQRRLPKIRHLALVLPPHGRRAH